MDKIIVSITISEIASEGELPFQYLGVYKIYLENLLPWTR